MQVAQHAPTVDLTYAEWVDRYRPIENPRSGCLIFQDDGADLKDLQRYSAELPHRIWAFHDQDGHGYITPGFGRGLHYFVTEVPFDPTVDFYVKWEDIEDEEDLIDEKINELKWVATRVESGIDDEEDLEDLKDEIEMLIDDFEQEWGRPYAPKEKLIALGLFSDE